MVTLVIDKLSLQIWKIHFLFSTLAARIKQYNMIIITKIIMKWFCPNDQSPFETL